MKSLFVWCDLTGRVYTDPDATLLQVRFVSRSGSDKFDFGTLTFCPQSRRSSCLCRFVGASLGDGETESNRTELSWAV